MQGKTITIEKLVFGGMGLARTGEGVIFVRDALPGERVEFEPCGKQGGVKVARPVTIITPSPARRIPACPLYGRCGGCDGLHIDYKTQVVCKKGMIAECMHRIGRIQNLPEIEIVCAEEFGYRQRAQIKIDRNGNAGFFARQTHGVVPVQNCPLLVHPLNNLLADIADKTITLPPHCQNLMAIAGDNGSIATFPVIKGQTVESVTITVGNRTFEVAGNGFFQSNRFLLERLGTWARDYIGENFCVDLYGGTGFFAVMLAEKFKEGVLIESVAAHVAAARDNFARNRISRFSVIEGVAEYLATLVKQKKIDCIIVDPPRPGLSPKVREAIALLKPKTLLYISCNPSTQARDAGFLISKAGYTIIKAALFDLYPNTHHIESILLLKKQ